MKSFITSGPSRQAIALFSLSDCGLSVLGMYGCAGYRWKLSIIPTPATPNSTPHTTFIADLLACNRVKSCIFGQTATFGQPSILFHISIIRLKNKLNKQTVKILMRRLIRRRLIWMSTVCKRMSEFT